MMRRLVVSLVVAAFLATACGSAAEPTTVMPSVTGERLDVAYSDLAYVGVAKDAVEIVGGGTFGVIDESNWQVCEQRPPAGAEIVDVRLVIDRECPANGSGAASPSDRPSAQPGAPASTSTMPNVVGMVLQDAQDRLQEMGSYLMDQEDASGQGRIQLIDSNWKVCSQMPAPGSELTGTTVVTLAAVKNDETCP